MNELTNEDLMRRVFVGGKEYEAVKVEIMARLQDGRANLSDPSASIADTAKPMALTSNQFAAIRAGKAALEKLGGLEPFGLVLQEMLTASVQSIADTAGAKYTQADMERYGKCYADARDKRRADTAKAKRDDAVADFIADFTNGEPTSQEVDAFKKGYDAAPPAPSSDTAGAKPVAQWQTKLREPILPECDTWINVSEEGARKAIEKWSHVYEVRALVLAAPPAPSVADAQVDDLRMLVQRLVHALNKASPGNDLGAKALDYLLRNGIGPSPLRESSVADAAGASESAYQRGYLDGMAKARKEND